jgi:hypothetical protein
MLKRSLMACLTIALMGLPALAGGRPMRLQRPVMYQSCQTGRCYAPPPITAYPVQSPAPVVTPSPSSPHLLAAPVGYVAPTYHYSTWPIPRGR